jgi:hypothetical protein
MLCGFVVGLLTSVVPLLQIADYGQRLMVTTGLTALVWLTVMLLTPPESPDVLERFVQTVRPPGPGWDQWRRRWDVQAAETLSTLLARFLFSSGILFGALLGSGAFLLHQQVIGWMGLVVAAISLLMLRRTGRAVTLV